ncbi:MAG: hypothetical protein U9P14_00455 [Gemmatimonadota bacterium]|nr:hypothetical protein [Gemmatimonadota bacterium]
MVELKQVTTRKLLTALVFLAVLVGGFYCMQFPGPADEEITQYEAMLRQGQWLDIFRQEDSRPFSRETIERYWSGSQLSDQRVLEASPPLARSLYGLLQPLGGLFTGDFESFRTGPVLAFAALAALFFWWLVPVFGLPGALACVVVLAVTPRALAAVIQATRYPLLTLLWFSAAFLFESGKSSGWKALLFGLAIGLGAAVSAIFLLIIPCLLIWMLIGKKTSGRWLMLLSGLVGILVLPPLLNPLWWHTPFSSYFSWIGKTFFSSSGYSVPVLYFNELYQSALPWHYVIVMLIVTMPIVGLVFILAGKLLAFKQTVFRGPVGLALITSTAFILVGLTGRFPASDGMAFFLPVYAAGAMMAGAGVAWLLKRINVRFPRLSLSFGILVFILILTPSVVWQVKLFPCQSSHYNAIIGFPKGANKAGLEICFDGSAAGREFLEKLIEKADEEKNGIKVVGAPLYFLERLGRLPEPVHLHQQLYGNTAILNRPGFFIDQDKLLFEHAIPVFKVERAGVTLLAVYDKDKEYNRLYRLYEAKFISGHANAVDSYYMGVLLDAAHRHDQANNLLRMTIEKDSTIAGAWYTLAYIDFHNQGADSAASFLRRAIALDPDNDTYNYLMTLTLGSHGDLEAATRCARAALEIQPYNARYNHEMGRLLLDLSRFSEARPYLERAIKADTLDLKSMHLIGLSYRKEKNWPMAEKAYQRIMKITGKNHVYLGQMAEMYREMSDYGRCAETYEKILEIRYNYPRVLAILGDLYHNKLDQSEKALKYYKDCLRYSPQIETREKIERIIERLEKKTGKSE